MCQKYTGKNESVGSFLRPEKLASARQSFQNKEITADELKQIEDEAIIDLIAKQKAIGLEFITDGEFRRATWHLDFMWGFNGIDHQPTKTGLPFAEETAYIDDTFLVGQLSFNDHHPFFEHLQFVQQFEDDQHKAKLTIPAPAQFLEQLIMPFAIDNTRKYYETNEALIEDLVSVYKLFIQKVYDLGLRYLQLDDCSWGLLVDERATLMFGTDKEGLDAIKELFVKTNNRAIEDKPSDLIINTHVCRGNFKSTYAVSGSYEDVARFLFAKENVNSFFLEFDDERSGGFEPLREITGDKEVVLGLITSKKPELEDKERIIARIKEAAQYVPLERLSLSPQCGFASTEEGNKLTEEEQWAKLQLVKEIADEVWGQKG